MEVLNSHLQKSIKEERSFSSWWGGLMKKNWPNIINLPCIKKEKKKEAHANCKWNPLLGGWYKLNFDGGQGEIPESLALDA